MADAYSGSNTPWIYMTTDISNVMPSDLEPVNKFINGYASLFDLIWTQCTKTKSLIIDLDGTLYNDKDATDYLKFKIPSKFYKHLSDIGKVEQSKIDQANSSYLRIIGNGISSTEAILLALQEDLGIKIELEEYLIWKDQNTEKLLDSLKLNKDISSALKKAKGGYKVFLLTNHTRVFTKNALEKIGCADIFEKSNIITINDLGITKPSNAILGILVDKYNIDISRSIFVGDRQAVDLDYAKNQCLGTVLVQNFMALPDFLNDCWLPFTWTYAKRKKYMGLELYLRNELLELL